MRIGLTGGIGSGKSTVARWWQSRGVTVVDTDALAHELCGRQGQALPAIAERFGADFVHPEHGLERARMRAHVLAHPQARQQLEALLHPMIQTLAQARAAAAPGWVLFDVPLLVESKHWRTQVDRILVVDCAPETQIERVIRRPGWTREQALAVLALQATRPQRRQAADAWVDNSADDLQSLHRALEMLALHWGFSATL
ncbi:dephospho-CoA kinase [Inhella inkyongensis]|uniref:Dephospho-CoA kinase n=1 Tax=Inhella inkyongensis TaxID=392593 RepID=A0A840RX94_9BURK|nr:dephospho-CoA kinase [Inhella inkyongensis]MBB5203327.1 dephospho-CoA kinase [Inhella inkyongensis]